MTEEVQEQLLKDAERLDFLEQLLGQCRYTGRVCVRWSVTGRGFRMCETSENSSRTSYSVREAIDLAMQRRLEFQEQREL